MRFRAEPIGELLYFEGFEDPGAGLLAHSVNGLREDYAGLFAGVRLEDREMLSAVTDRADDGGAAFKVDQGSGLIPGDCGCWMIGHLLAPVTEIPDFVLAFNYLAENKALIRYHQGRFFLEVITG